MGDGGAHASTVLIARLFCAACLVPGSFRPSTLVVLARCMPRRRRNFLQHWLGRTLQHQRNMLQHWLGLTPRSLWNTWQQLTLYAYARYIFGCICLVVRSTTNCSTTNWLSGLPKGASSVADNKAFHGFHDSLRRHFSWWIKARSLFVYRLLPRGIRVFCDR